jgi:CheY-like chemotaxis protein
VITTTILFVDDSDKARKNETAAIEKCWKEMFGESVKIYPRSDLVADTHPSGEHLAFDNVWQYDAVLLDVAWGNHPHGIELAKEIRRRCPEMPIIVYSGRVKKKDFKELIPVGIAAYVSKGEPSADACCAAIHDVLERAGSARPGQPLHRLIRRLLTENPNVWCHSVVAEAASSVWRYDNPYEKWGNFWAKWAVNLGRKHIKIPCDELGSFFSKKELLMLSVHPGFRGHLEHVLHVYFTGYLVSHFIPDFKQHVAKAVHELMGSGYSQEQDDSYWDYFQVCWLVAATLHDVAYPLEMLPDVIAEASSIRKKFSFATFEGEMDVLKATGCAWESVDGKHAREAFRFVFGRLYGREDYADAVENNVLYQAQGVRRFNHGIASGMLFRAEAEKWKGTAGALPEVFVKWISVAMAVHSLKNVSKQMGLSVSLRDPLSFLLCLCDELQVWNRSRPDETVASTHFRRVELVGLKCDTNGLTADLLYELFPMIDDVRRQSAINHLTSQLSRDQEILQGFLKPSPFKVVISNRLREPPDELPTITL